MIPVAKPDITEKELAQVREALESGWIGLGPKVDQFETEFGDKFGYKHVIATNSGTSALDLALKSSDLSGSTALVPPISWISTAFVAEYNGLDVEWVDVRPGTLNMDPAVVREHISEDTAVVIPVHYGGNPAAVDEITAIAHEYDAIVVEDCAHATGSSDEGRPVGTAGDIGCFSFQATKPLTTGEGGALITNNNDLAARAKRMSQLGVNKSTHERESDDSYSWYYEVTNLGYKYFMHDISAGLGLAQLERFEDMRATRQSHAERYHDGLDDIESIKLLTSREDTISAWYNYTVRVPADDREPLIQHLDSMDIGATVHYMPLYKHPVYKGCNPDTPTTERVWEEILTLPMSSAFSPDSINKVINSVRSYFT